MIESSDQKEDQYNQKLFSGLSNQVEKDRVLCVHCKRTKNNGIRCLGICVSESEY